MKLSIVATLYKSAPYIIEFYNRATATAKKLVGEDYEIVFVNDGSPDNSLEVAINLHKKDDKIKIVDLSRNFGHHKAMMTGLDYAEGERTFLIDSDLEEEPEWLLNFSDMMEQEEADVVYGRQSSRKGGWFERVSGQVFYTVFNFLANIDHPRNVVTARLMSKRYVDALLRHREREMVLSCLWVITGFKQHEVIVKKLGSSKSTYSLAKKFAHAANAITSFSETPLKMIAVVGFCIFLTSLFYAGYLIANWFFLSQVVGGWTSVIVSIWLLGGLNISFVGVIGIYLAKIFLETKHRPYTIVRKVYGR